MTRTGFEPVLPPWKGGVLTAWPTGHVKILCIAQYVMAESEGFEPSRPGYGLRDFQSRSFDQLGQLSMAFSIS